MFVSFLEEEFSQGPMLWGLGRMGEVQGKLLGEIGPWIVPFLTSPHPQLRALAAWSLGKLEYEAAAPGLQALLADENPVQLYEGGAWRGTSVGQLAREALARLGLPEPTGGKPP